MKKLPFYLTLSRIVLAPFLFIVFLSQSPAAWWFTVFLFIALSITDFFDGHLARKYNVTSNFGKVFDPTGDKILVLFALVILSHFKGISPWFLIILLSRDILINSLRAYSASQNIILSARFLGKLKTTFQMIAIPLILAPPLKFIDNFKIGVFVLWMSCILSLISLFDYAYQMQSSQIDKSKS